MPIASQRSSTYRGVRASRVMTEIATASPANAGALTPNSLKELILEMYDAPRPRVMIENRTAPPVMNESRALVWR